MRVISNISVRVRMKQFLALIILVLIGILFSLTVGSKNQANSNKGMETSVSESLIK